MNHAMDCPHCGEGELELEITNFSRGCGATHWHPAEPDELEWDVIENCGVCGCDGSRNMAHIDDFLREQMDRDWESARDEAADMKRLQMREDMIDW